MGRWQRCAPDDFAVGDLAEFCVLAGTGEREGVYNAGSGRGASINQIVEAIRVVTQVQFEAVYKPGRPIDVPRCVLDCSRAKNDFSWESKPQFVPQLHTTWKWIKSHGQLETGNSA